MQIGLLKSSSPSSLHFLHILSNAPAKLSATLTEDQHTSQWTIGQYQCQWHYSGYQLFIQQSAVLIVLNTQINKQLNKRIFTISLRKQIIIQQKQHEYFKSALVCNKESVIKLLKNTIIMKEAVDQKSDEMHIFFNNTPLKRNNISVIDMNKSKIKFMNKIFVQKLNGIVQKSTDQITTPVEEYNLQYRMKQKFEELYRRIQKISKNVNVEEFKGKTEKRFIVNPSDQITMKRTHSNNAVQIRHELMKIGFKPRETRIQRIKQTQQQPKDVSDIQINNVSQSKQQPMPRIQIINNTRYRPRLAVVKPMRMSNNIRDYLSVEKIRLKDLQQSIIQRHHNVIQRSKHSKVKSSLYSQLTQSLKHQANNSGSPILPTIVSQPKPDLTANKLVGTKYKTGLKHKKFQAPFQTYYYRDLLWRVAYSNQQLLQFPEEYESKIRVFIGKGNNSRLVKSIINRRPWYQITDKIEQATFVWTQIKIQSVFAGQSKVKIEKEKLSIQKQQATQLYASKNIWTNIQQKAFKKYFNAYRGAQSRMTESMKFRNKTMTKIWQNQFNITHKQLIKSQLSASMSMEITQNSDISSSINLQQSSNNNLSTRIKMHNHFPNSFLIGNKKALFQTMSNFYTSKGEDVFNYLPMTFHICDGIEDQKYLKFLNYYYAIAKKAEGQDKNTKFNAWIVKPGQNSNRGNGITVCLTLDAIKNLLKKKEKHMDGSNKTFIVQKYIQRPLLYKKRKFDIRHYIMINCSNGYFKGYWFNEGYVRTTSSEYTLKQGTGNIHLTNDAVQKNLPDYGKFQKGNKISYDQLEEYLSKINGMPSFWEHAYPKMKKIGTDVINACASSLDSDRKTNFQIYGMDFMLDQYMNVWLIQVNTNPCLELSCPLLAKIIPKMVENSLQICLDPQYPPPTNFSPKGATFKQNCVLQTGYQLVYDQRFQQVNKSDQALLNDESLKKQQDDCFEDDGQDWNQD